MEALPSEPPETASKAAPLAAIEARRTRGALLSTSNLDDLPCTFAFRNYGLFFLKHMNQGIDKNIMFILVLRAAKVPWGLCMVSVVFRSGLSSWFTTWLAM